MRMVAEKKIEGLVGKSDDIINALVIRCEIAMVELVNAGNHINSLREDLERMKSGKAIVLQKDECLSVPPEQLHHPRKC